MSRSSSTFHHQGSWLPPFSELTESIANSAADVAPPTRQTTPPGGRIAFRSPQSHDDFESPHCYSSTFTASPWSPLKVDPLSANRDPFHHINSPRTPSSASIAPTTDYGAVHVQSSDPESGEGTVQIPAKLNYTEALEAIANSAFALYDFARRCTADCHTGNDESTLLVKLPSKRVVNIMANNSDVIKKRMDDIKSARKWFEESTSGPHSKKSHRGSSADTVKKPGRGRRRIREIGVDAYGKKTIPARNAAGKCYNCDCTESTEWRKGPEGARTLCNRCGLQYSKRNMPVKQRS
ncbi:hypothetical protein QBC40DRAFT_228415 [Triangularia verruculosa]|uniref:GATA-type domain-containing protein n=1 Tax=Triangularia verruculosa TaxID=2587418 RepID=A0AAN6XEJ9_9PEZI|nr:hypothetical protein QBC40DRAFT_228415 [Triangularia verruculosa]